MNIPNMLCGLILAAATGIGLLAINQYWERPRSLGGPVGVATAELERTPLYNLCNRVSYMLFLATETDRRRIAACRSEVRRLLPERAEEYEAAWKAQGYGR